MIDVARGQNRPPPETPMDRLRRAATFLARAGIDSAQIDAELLMADVLGVGRGHLFLARSLSDDEIKQFGDLVRRRGRREPLQHLLGTAAFRHLLVGVGPGVFVPRPETELLVDAVLPTLRASAAPVAVDLCSGSGALALAIAAELPNAEVVAVECSPGALEWLRANVAATALTERVRIVAGDLRAPELLDQLARLLGDRFATVDALVCNPPYVPEETVVGPEVAFDPAEAVFAGPDGLALMPDVFRVASALLRPGGVAAIEHDDTQGVTVPALMRSGPDWTDVFEHDDLAGRPRYVTATRR